MNTQPAPVDPVNDAQNTLAELLARVQRIAAGDPKVGDDLQGVVAQATRIMTDMTRIAQAQATLGQALMQTRQQLTQAQSDLAAANTKLAQQAATGPVDKNGKPLKPGAYISLGAALFIGLGALGAGGLTGWMIKASMEKKKQLHETATARELPPQTTKRTKETAP